MDFCPSSIHVGRGRGGFVFIQILLPILPSLLCLGSVDSFYTPLKPSLPSPRPAPHSFDVRDKVLGKFSSERAQEIRRFLQWVLLNEVRTRAKNPESTCLCQLSGLRGEEAVEAQQASGREAAAWDPRARGRWVPRLLRCTRLVLPGTLYLLPLMVAPHALGEPPEPCQVFQARKATSARAGGRSALRKADPLQSQSRHLAGCFYLLAFNVT